MFRPWCFPPAKIWNQKKMFRIYPTRCRIRSQVVASGTGRARHLDIAIKTSSRHWLTRYPKLIGLARLFVSQSHATTWYSTHGYLCSRHRYSESQFGLTATIELTHLTPLRLSWDILMTFPDTNPTIFLIPWSISSLRSLALRPYYSVPHVL